MILVHSKVNRLVLQVIDAAFACLAFVVAHAVRTYVLDPLVPFELQNIGTLADYTIFLPFIAVATPVILYRLNFYTMTLSGRLANLFNLALQAGLILFMGLVVLQFLTKLQMSRIIFIIYVPTFAGAIFLREYLVRQLRAYQARHREHLRNMVVVTDAPDPLAWQRRMSGLPEYGFHVCQTLPLDSFRTEALVECLHRESVELVVFDIREGELTKIVNGIRACEDEGIETWFSTGFFETRISEPSIDRFQDQTFLIFRSTPDSSWQLFAKEIIDRVGAAALLAVLGLPMLLVAAVVRLTSPGPALFKQRRSGHYGRPFVMYKFRSMVSNAEQRKEELRALNEMDGPVFKVSRDPRITRIGYWLRRTSIDELPQLLNVLKGEMSLVGPRPLPVDETLAISKNAQRRRLSVKPGITCLWQISGRNEVTSFEEWVRLDLEYIDRWSVWLDIKILLLTLPAVFFAKGAK